jgi:hypothetical protein
LIGNCNQIDLLAAKLGAIACDAEARFVVQLLGMQMRFRPTFSGRLTQLRRSAGRLLALLLAIAGGGFAAAEPLPPSVQQDDPAGDEFQQMRDDARRAVARGDYQSALKIFNALADQNDAEGQSGLGVLYRDGLGVVQDDSEAAKWFAFAAAQGRANAQYNLGAMFEAGRGVVQSRTNAINWYQRAAAQGQLNAQERLDAINRTDPRSAEDDGKPTAIPRPEAAPQPDRKRPAVGPKARSAPAPSAPKPAAAASAVKMPEQRAPVPAAAAADVAPSVVLPHAARDDINTKAFVENLASWSYEEQRGRKTAKVVSVQKGDARLRVQVVGNCGSQGLEFVAAFSDGAKTPVMAAPATAPDSAAGETAEASGRAQTSIVVTVSGARTFAGGVASGFAASSYRFVPLSNYVAADGSIDEIGGIFADVRTSAGDVIVTVPASHPAVRQLAEFCLALGQRNLSQD